MNEETIMECDISDTTQIINSNSSFKKPKMRKRRKIRRLVDSGDLEQTKPSKSKKFKRFLVSSALIVFIIVLIMGNYFIQNNANTKNIIREFLKNYRDQYMEIVHGKINYCDQKPLDTTILFDRIKESDVLHQPHALHRIEVALRNEDDINAIALVGPVGVGKSSFIRALKRYFPWQENVHIYAWNIYAEDESEKFHLIRKLIDGLSECGRNLLIVENMRAGDHGAVAVINQLLLEANNDLRKRVVVFYVFSLNTMLTEEEYADEEKTLQSLPDCNVINFKPFTNLELRDCIQREAEMENISLTIEDFDEIVKTIDPFKSGCKTVNAKVLVYGTYATKKG